MAGSTALVVAASTFPASRRSDGLAHVALPGSDSHWTLQGQGWLNRNDGGNCLLIWLLWSFLFQRPRCRGSPQPKSRMRDGLCLLTAHRGEGGQESCDEANLLFFPVPCMVLLLPLSLTKVCPSAWLRIHSLINFNVKSCLLTDSKRVIRTEYESHLWLPTLQGYNPTM